MSLVGIRLVDFDQALRATQLSGGGVGGDSGSRRASLLLVRAGPPVPRDAGLAMLSTMSE